MRKGTVDVRVELESSKDLLSRNLRRSYCPIRWMSCRRQSVPRIGMQLGSYSIAQEKCMVEENDNGKTV